MGCATSREENKTSFPIPHRPMQPSPLQVTAPSPVPATIPTISSSWKDHAYSDCTVILNGSSSYRLHQWPLARGRHQSSFFHMAFAKAPEDINGKTVRLDFECTAHVWELYLDFVYRGFIQSVELESFVPLYQLGDYLGTSTLVESLVGVIREVPKGKVAMSLVYKMLWQGLQLHQEGCIALFCKMAAREFNLVEETAKLTEEIARLEKEDSKRSVPPPICAGLEEIGTPSSLSLHHFPIPIVHRILCDHGLTIESETQLYGFVKLLRNVMTVATIEEEQLLWTVCRPAFMDPWVSLDFYQVAKVPAIFFAVTNLVRLHGKEGELTNILSNHFPFPGDLMETYHLKNQCSPRGSKASAEYQGREVDVKCPRTQRWYKGVVSEFAPTTNKVKVQFLGWTFTHWYQLASGIQPFANETHGLAEKGAHTGAAHPQDLQGWLTRPAGHAAIPFVP